MILMWIGDILLIAVVLPVVVAILNQVLTPIRQIKAYADDIAEHGALFVPHLQALGQLTQTRDLVKQVGGGLERYIRAIDQIR